MNSDEIESLGYSNRAEQERERERSNRAPSFAKATDGRQVAAQVRASATNKPQFTPGPWSAEDVMSEHPFDICLGYSVPSEGNPVMLASCFADEGTQPFISVQQACANAKLIAAAPDLVEALRWLIDERDACEFYVRALEGREEFDANGNPTPCDSPAINKARAVLAKALS